MGAGDRSFFLNRVLRIVRSENQPSFEIEGDHPTRSYQRERAWVDVRENQDNGHVGKS